MAKASAGMTATGFLGAIFAVAASWWFLAQPLHPDEPDEPEQTASEVCEEQAGDGIMDVIMCHIAAGFKSTVLDNTDRMLGNKPAPPDQIPLAKTYRRAD